MSRNSILPVLAAKQLRLKVWDDGANVPAFSAFAIASGGSSLPVGLRGTPAAPDITTVTLEPGSFAVMISDGVADPSRDEWLQDLLAGWGGDDPQTLANLILSESIRRERLQDDCAVQVLYRLPEPEQPV